MQKLSVFIANLKAHPSSALSTKITPFISILHSHLLSIQLQYLCFKLIQNPPLNNSTNTNEASLYKFIIQDRKHSQIKYISIGELGNNNLVFFRVTQERDVGYSFMSYSDSIQGEGKKLRKLGNHIFGCNLAEKYVNIGSISN